MTRIQVAIPGRSYSVAIGPGVAATLPGILKSAQPTNSTAVIADERVAELHWPSLAQWLPKDTLLLQFPSGEGSKSLAMAESLYFRLAAAEFDRSGLIITFGGGVAGDLGGFVAATWMRGVRYIQVPTTLEAAVDASVGGKTAVNLAVGKNLVGAFHQPIGVVIDTRFLETLPQREFVAGLAESVKHALVRDAEFLAWHEANAAGILAREPDVVERLIARNCAIKADVVTRDEHDHDLRAILNYGHTMGHAIEHVAGYALRHGECVALGMVAENEIAVARGLLSRATAERAAAALAKLGLPTRLPQRLDSGALISAVRLDKKNRGGSASMVLLRAVGESVRVDGVAESEIEKAARFLNDEA